MHTDYSPIVMSKPKPSPRLDGYRCDACRMVPKRCAACRAKRAAARQERRELKRKQGLCLDCSEPALDGLTRCAVHNAMNNELSGASHARKRTE